MSRVVSYACTNRATYQAAVFRIGLAAVTAAFLLREWPHRRVLYGDRSPMSFDMALALTRDERTFTVLNWTSDRLWFEIVYTLTILMAVAVMVGWHTRATSILLMVGVLSLENHNSLVGDGGDNVLRIMVIYLVFTRCAEAWSLDARRARSLRPKGSGDLPGVALWSMTGLFLLVTSHLMPGGWPHILGALWAVHGIWYAVNRWFPRHEMRSLLDSCAAMLHNTAMLVIAAQICLIYATAGWYKVQGSRWQEGSALYYALNLDYFAPWPWLSDAVAANTMMGVIMCYGTVMLQVAFPFTLANRRVKNVLLGVMIAEHLGIAVLFGLPFLSLAMIVCDTVFLPTTFLVLLGTRCTGFVSWVGRHKSGAADLPRPAVELPAGAVRTHRQHGHRVEA